MIDLVFEIARNFTLLLAVILGMAVLTVATFVAVGKAFQKVMRTVRVWPLLIDFIWHRARQGHFPCEPCRRAEPIPMVLYCPKCGKQHIDAPEHHTGWDNPPHRTHLCLGCGWTWRPSLARTTGVEELPAEGEN